MESLGEFIQNNQNFKNIYIGNKITDKGIKLLLPHLIDNTSIRWLVISSNIGITDKSVPLLKEIIQKSNIEDINIGSTSVTNENILVVLKNIKNTIKNGCEKIGFQNK